MKYPLWKPVLLLLVVAGCALLLWTKGLNPGIDLAGGTTLTYAVQVPEGQNTDETIENTIEILKERVDPAGIMNLVWRAEAGSRLTVQMAQAPPVVAEVRGAFESARKELLAGNFSQRAVVSALALSGTQRAEAMEKLIQNNPAKATELRDLLQFAVERDGLRQTYDAAQQAYTQALDNAGDAPDDAAKSQVEALRKELDAATLALLAARDAYQAKFDALLSDNVTGEELARVLDLSTKPGKDGAPSPRADALAALKQAHPTRADEIDKAASLWSKYEEVKGPLDDPNDLIRLLRGAGVLEFRIAATPGERPVNVQTYRDRLAEQGPKAGRSEPWRWFEVQSIEKYIDSPKVRDALEADPSLIPQVFAEQRSVVGQGYGGSYYILLGNTPDVAMTGSEDWELASASRGSDQLGRPSVDFGMDAAGAQRLGQITGANIGRPMAIVLDGKVVSSPNLNDKITSRGTITGSFSNAEVRYLINTLRAGSLGSTLSHDPISIRSTGPQLGQDNLDRGVYASVLSLAAVAAFMIVYYFGAGLVAVIALVFNMVIILGVMAMTEATFTLPGIAGLVLTIGMAVDANVLIFERIREELAGKADLPTAVRIGFGKALSSILDSNITTLLTCLVLYYTATSEIKGFAVVLSIGIMATLFTALFGTRIFIDMAVVFGKIKRLPMLPTAVPAIGRLLHPNVDWFALRKFFIPFSLLVIVAGGFMLWDRGGDLLDIEFRAGTEVTFELKDGAELTMKQTRERLTDFAESNPPALKEMDGTDVDWSHLADATVVSINDPITGKTTGFSVATLIQNADAVSDAVKTTFADVLDTTLPLSFDGDDLKYNQAGKRVRIIDSAALSQVLGDPLVQEDVGEYLGGAALVLDGVSPATTVQDVQQRIARMHSQPDYADLGYRQFDVIGLNRAGASEAGEPTFDRFAIVVTDGQTNYLDSPDTFAAADGLAGTEWGLVKDALSQDTSLASVSNFSSQVSGTMQQRAIAAMVLSMLVVVAYIALRFGSVRYGLAAIIALVHDVAAAVGLLAISGWLYQKPWAQSFLLDDFKINLAIVAALLTLIGYSLNDTIIVFDRIRENKGRLHNPTAKIINDSINQTISRTVLTSGTTLLAVLVLYLFGGPGVHGFAFTMLIGIFVGTYSSFAVAAPLLLFGQKDPAVKTHTGALEKTSPAGA